uniref:Heat shock protein 70 n=1 Tax=Panagrolaimus davidi TaxID=227884 RepID=A0A914QQD7_9BILA
MDSLPKPNAVYYDKPVHRNIIMNFDTNILCSCYDLNYYNFATAALIKARIIGNDKEFEELDVEVLLYFQLQIEFKQKVIISVEKFSAIPLKRQATIMADLNNNELTISEEWNIFTVPLPDFKKILVTLTIEENMIYTVKSTIVSYELFETYAFPHIIRSNFDTINAIGIDLGTTRCCAAVNRRNGIGTVALDNQGERLLPSYVAYDEKNVKFGRIVIDRLRDHSKASVFDSKRYIGKKFRDINIDNNCILKLVSTGNMPKNNNTNYYKMKYNEIYFEIESYSGKVLKRPEEVSADLLKRIKERAEEFQGTNLNEVVITVPAAFTEAQNEATYVAAKLAGWDLIRFLPEPVAAAFGYFIDRSIPNNSTVLLFDLGGGTLDVCIFKIQNNELVIISRSGDPNLGGRDFDNILIKYFRDKMKNP